MQRTEWKGTIAREKLIAAALIHAADMEVDIDDLTFFHLRARSRQHAHLIGLRLGLRHALRAVLDRLTRSFPRHRKGR